MDQNSVSTPFEPIQFADVRATFETELFDIIDRLMTRASAATNAVVEKAAAAGQSAVQTALAELAEKTRQHEVLTESYLELEIQLEELRSQMETEREQTKAANEINVKETSARQAAEDAVADAGRQLQQTVAQYESRLSALEANLDRARAEVATLHGQLETEASDRARLMAALKIVQEACAHAESSTPADAAAPRHKPQPESPSMQDQVDTETDRAEPAPSLRLVPDQHALEPNRELSDYVTELFDRIDMMYWVDQAAHDSADLVNRLCAHLRYARESLMRRTEETAGVGELFDRELNARLEMHSATPLGRHLAIAAYQSTEDPEMRAVAS